MQKVLIILLSFLIINSFSASAQYYNFQNYTVEDGLPQSQVFALFQDERSNLWLGTYGGGLARYNGKEFEVFRRNDGLISDVVLEIIDDKNGDLIIKTNLGISVFDGKKFKNYPFTGGDLISSERMCMDKNGHIWLRVRRENNHADVYKFDGNTFHDMSNAFKELEDLTWQHTMAADSEENILISAGDHLYVISDDQIALHKINSLPEIQDKQVAFVNNLIDGKLFIVTIKKTQDSAIYLYSESEGLIKYEIPKEMGDSFNFFYEDRRGNIWLNSPANKTLYRWDRLSGNNQIDHFKEDSGLPIDGIRCVLEDKEGNIWVGTDGGGLFKYGGAKFISFLSNQGLEDYFVWSIQQDSKGNYWFGTALNGIFKYDGKDLKGFQHLEKRSLGIVREILEYNGSYLIGSRHGLWVFDEKSIKRANSDFGMPDFSGVNDILITEEGVWIASTHQGIYFFDGKNSTNYNTSSSGIGSNSIDDILLDKSGVIWFATRGGLSRLKDGEIKNFINTEFGLFAIMQITQDRLGNIWAATYGGGVCMIQIDENDQMFVKKIDNESGLSSNNVYSILTDNEGNIWAGCQQGVDKLTLDSTGNLLSIRNYDNYEGFTGFENNGKANFIDKEGQLWFGTIKGAMVYNPKMDIINNNPPKTNITKLKLFYKDVDWNSDDLIDRHRQLTSWTGLPDKLVLPYNKHQITVEFEGSSSTVPEKVQFQWKLDGMDSDWSPISNRTDAVYANLSPGNYTFMVLSGNSDDIWGEKPTAFSFTIRPPFWATWWFRSMILLFIITVILIISWLRNKFIREKRQELEQLVAYKTKKLEKQKNEILHKNEELEKQYNDLDMLSKIGRDITANITVESLLESVFKKLNSLMDASVMGFGIYRRENRIIEFPRIITTEKNVDQVKISYDEKFCMAVECLKENKEIIINNFEEEFSDRFCFYCFYPFNI
jgi:ligand-binding sensor domain-containing protein